MLDNERKTFEEKREELVAQSLGKFVLIKDSNVIGVYNTIEEALSEGARRFTKEPFLARRIAPKADREINIPALTLGILRANSTHTV